MTIRGRSTIQANPEPLIVLENSPFDGDINSVNPEDIESVTVLQDATASSIWGAYVGNGVIVLTSKKRRVPPTIADQREQQLAISEKPDLYYTPTIPIGEFIEVEQWLFNQRVSAHLNPTGS